MLQNTSADVERSVSVYKNILSDNRQNVCSETVNYHLFCTNQQQ